MRDTLLLCYSLMLVLFNTASLSINGPQYVYIYKPRILIISKQINTIQPYMDH